MILHKGYFSKVLLLTIVFEHVDFENASVLTTHMPFNLYLY